MCVVHVACVCVHATCMHAACVSACMCACCMCVQGQVPAEAKRMCEMPWS